MVDTKRFALALLFFVGIAAFAHAQSIEVDVEPQKIFVGPTGDGFAFASYHNVSAKPVTVLVSAVHGEQVDAFPMVKEFILNPGEKTSFSVGVKALDVTLQGEYPIVVLSRVANTSESHSSNFSVVVGGSAQISLAVKDNGQSFCRQGYSREFDVLVKNNGSVGKQVLLSAESGVFVPVVDEPEFFLHVGQSKTVRVKINFNGFTQFGKYSVGLKAVAGNEEVMNNIYFSVDDCPQQDSASFGFDLGSGSLSIAKFETKRVYFTLTNHRNESQGVFFSAVSDLAVREGQFSFTLGPFETQRGFVEIEARRDDEPKTHRVDLFAWSEFGDKKQRLYVDVKKDRAVSLALLNDNLTGVVCSAAQSAIFEVRAQNVGDSDVTLGFSVDNDFGGIGVTLSHETIKLSGGESEIVRVVVLPSFSASVGTKTLWLEVKGKGFDYSERIPLTFTVADAPFEPQKTELKIVSAPTELNVAQGESKSVNIKVQNPSQTTATNLVARIRGLDSTQFNFDQEQIGTIGPGETASFDLRLAVLPQAAVKSYDLTIEIISENGFVAEPFRLNVLAKEQGEKRTETGFVAGLLGLFGLAGPGFSQGSLLIILLIIVAATILVFLLSASSGKKQAFLVFNKESF